MAQCRTPEREVGGSRPTAAVLCPWASHFTPRKYWLITYEAVAPSRHDWKIVDWDVKPQHKQKITKILPMNINMTTGFLVTVLTWQFKVQNNYIRSIIKIVTNFLRWMKERMRDEIIWYFIEMDCIYLHRIKDENSKKKTKKNTLQICYSHFEDVHMEVWY